MQLYVDRKSSTVMNRDEWRMSHASRLQHALGLLKQASDIISTVPLSAHFSLAVLVQQELDRMERLFSNEDTSSSSRAQNMTIDLSHMSE